MDCDEARRLLSPLFDRELGLERSLEVETHIEDCVACAADFQNLGELRASLRERLPYEKAPDRLKQRLATVASGAEKSPTQVAPPLFSRRAAAGLLLCTSAFLALLAFVVLRAPLYPRSASTDRIADEALSGHLRSLMASHLADVLSSDQHTVKPYFAGKLDFSPPVVDLAKSGFPLAAGRLDYMDGHPVAALVYRRNRHVINLFVWPSTGAGDTESVTLSRRGYQIVHWTAGGMEEWAVSDLNASELDLFAGELRRPH